MLLFSTIYHHKYFSISTYISKTTVINIYNYKYFFSILFWQSHLPSHQSESTEVNQLQCLTSSMRIIFHLTQLIYTYLLFSLELKIWYFFTPYNNINNLKNLISFYGTKDAFDCAGIRAQVFRLPVDCSRPGLESQRSRKRLFSTGRYQIL